MTTHAQIRPEKTLRLHLRLILSTDTTYNQNTKTITKKPGNPGEGEESDLQSYHIVRIKCSVFNKKVTRHIKKQENMDQSKGEKSIETIPEKDLMSDILDKDFKQLKELRENMEKAKKTMYEQNGNSVKR